MMTRDQFELVLRNVVDDAVREIKADNALVRGELSVWRKRLEAVEERVSVIERRMAVGEE